MLVQNKSFGVLASDRFFANPRTRAKAWLLVTGAHRDSARDKQNPL